MNLSHFEALVVFSLAVSTVFAIITKNTPKEQAKYGVFVFGCFIGVAILAGWLMYPIPF